MHPFVNPGRRVIFWWSPKCGCTTVKSIMLESMVFDHVSSVMDADEASVRAAFWSAIGGGPPSDTLGRMVSDFLKARYVQSIHCYIAGSMKRLGLGEAASMRNILFVRDPLKRFVSGVVDKHIEGEFSFLFRPSSFLDAARRMHLLEKHHFTPQAAGAYIAELEYERTFDVESIDYEYLSGLLGMKVEPRRLNVKSYESPCVPGMSFGYDDIAKMKAARTLPRYECFYDDESLSVVSGFYAADFGLMQRCWRP
jgi:hypothetical protein